MCIAARDENHKILDMNFHLDTNEQLLQNVQYLKGNEVAHLRVDDYLAASYMSYWVSFEKKISFDDLLKPLGQFGKFLGSLLVSLNHVNVLSQII